jgi:hypothetical protein
MWVEIRVDHTPALSGGNRLGTARDVLDRGDCACGDDELPLRT